MISIRKKLTDVTNYLKSKIKERFNKTLGIKTIHEYKNELSKFLSEIELLSDRETIDELVEELGIFGTAKEYSNLNKYFKDYYRLIIKEINQSENANEELRRLAKKTEEAWADTLKEVIAYLYEKKKKIMYGESLEPDYFDGVKTFHANSFSDRELPWLRKDPINEIDYFDEGLIGLTAGAISGTVLAMTLSSLSATFKIHPKLLSGLTIGLSAIIGHFIQKHYFIDLTNYVKLKRYIEYEPEAYEFILEMLQKNATKLKDKDPIKYKKVLKNLERLQKNPPPEYRSYLDDEIEAEYDDDPGMFDVYDKDRNLVKRGTSELSSYGSSRNSSRRSSRRSHRDYDVNDLGSIGDVESELDNLMRYN